MRALNLVIVTCGLLLLPVAAMSQTPAPDEDLQREWLEVQASKDRQMRKDWWQSISLVELNAYIQADAEPNAPDRRRWTPLHSAARYNPDPAVVLALVNAGAVVDAKDKSGDTPLHWAAAENTNVEITAALIAAGANVNARDRYGWQPIHTAADRNSNPEIIEALVAAGAERNKRAYFVLARPAFLLQHNSNMSEVDKKRAMALLKKID